MTKFVPSFRRAIAVGVALAVVPATVALASTSVQAAHSKSTVAAAPLLPIYPFNENCTLPEPQSSFSANPAGGGTWTLAPHVQCMYPHTRMTIAAALQRNGHTLLGSTGACLIGVGNIPTLSLCKQVAGHVHTLKVGSLGLKGTWWTIDIYTIQGPDALFFAPRHPSHCKFEIESVTAVCSYIVDQVTF
jgi:hypothetical protein